MSPTEVAIGIGSTHLSSSAYVLNIGTGELYKVDGRSLNKHAIQENEFTSRLLTLYSDLNRLTTYAGFDLRQCTGHVTISLPGVALPNQQRSALVHSQSVFRGPRVGISILDDTWATYYAESLSMTGISAIAGVGASVCIADQGFRLHENYKMDGWGPVIGDFGSAFDISVNYFRTLNRKKDSTPEVNCTIFPLIKELFSKTDFVLSSPSHVQNWCDGVAASVGSEWRAPFSLTAKAISYAADAPMGTNSDARTLIIDAAARFSETVVLAVKRALSFDVAPKSIVIHGEMISWSCLYTDVLKSRVYSQVGVPLVYSRFGPAIGALLWSCFRDNVECLPDRIHLRNPDAIDLEYLQSVRTRALEM